MLFAVLREYDAGVGEGLTHMGGGGGQAYQWFSWYPYGGARTNAWPVPVWPNCLLLKSTKYQGGQGCGSGSGKDPYSLNCRIRICIQNPIKVPSNFAKKDKKASSKIILFHIFWK